MKKAAMNLKGGVYRKAWRKERGGRNDIIIFSEIRAKIKNVIHLLVEVCIIVTFKNIY